MADTKITFLSSLNRGMNPDLHTVRKYLSAQIQDISFRYFVDNEVPYNYMVSQGVKAAKKEFCKDATNIICIDESLNLGKKGTDLQGAKILIAFPFENIMQSALEAETGNVTQKKSLHDFTHIIAPSKFVRETLSKMYQIKEDQIVKDEISPFAWKLCQREEQIAQRKELEYFYPGLAGKKVCSIITKGTLKPEEQKRFAEVSLEKIIQNLGDGWFLFTNCPELLERAAALPSRYLNSFGYLNKIRYDLELLYFSDAVVTNSSMVASYFAAQRKKIYCLNYKNTYFEKYMSAHYPRLYLENPGKLVNLNLEEKDYIEENKAFSEYFSYGAEADPCETIKNWIVRGV